MEVHHKEDCQMSGSASIPALPESGEEGVQGDDRVQARHGDCDQLI